MVHYTNINGECTPIYTHIGFSLSIYIILLNSSLFIKSPIDQYHWSNLLQDTRLGYGARYKNIILLRKNMRD